MTASYLYRIEEGERTPSADRTQLLADFLGMRREEVLRSVEEQRLSSTPIAKAPAFIPMETLEARANRDRMTFLQKVGRSRLRFPSDRNLIARVLCGLDVIEDQILLGAANRRVFAGLFPGAYEYRGTPSAIVVTTSAVRGNSKGEVSDKTKVFHVLHEIGHFQFHWKPTAIMNHEIDKPIYCSSGDRTPAEFQANAYASSFLMPLSELKELIGDRKVFDIRHESRGLCEAFFVEPWMLEFRLRRLGIRVLGQ